MPGWVGREVRRKSGQLVGKHAIGRARHAVALTRPHKVLCRCSKLRVASQRKLGRVDARDTGRYPLGRLTDRDHRPPYPVVVLGAPATIEASAIAMLLSASKRAISCVDKPSSSAIWRNRRL